MRCNVAEKKITKKICDYSENIENSSEEVRFALFRRFECNDVTT